jgi:hypothetical protein
VPRPTTRSEACCWVRLGKTRCPPRLRPSSPDQDRAGRRRVPQAVGVHIERAPCLPVAHPRAVEEGVQSGGEVLRPPPAFRVVRERPEREDRAVAYGDDEDVEPRPPELDERWVLPRGRFGPLDTCVDRQERGSRHAVLQPCPRRPPKGAPSGWEPLVERADVSPERDDLQPGDVEPRPGHAASPRSELSRCRVGAASPPRVSHAVKAGRKGERWPVEKVSTWGWMLAGSGSSFHGSRRACRGPLLRTRLARRPRLSDPGLGVSQPVGLALGLDDLASVALVRRILGEEEEE